MSDRVSALDASALGANRRAMRWLAGYMFVVWSVFCAWLGELGLALIGILCIELVNVFWRYLPRQATDMPDPTPAAWRVPMRAVRLSLVVWHIAAMASSAFVVTIILVIIGVIARPRQLGMDNALVAIALGLWLVTRPLWFPRFARAVFAVAGKLGGDSRPTGGARLSIAADGIEVTVPPQVRSDASARRSWSWHFAFAEIEELKALTENEAASYTLSALEYDPTIAVRANVDMARYASGQIERPAIYMGGVGPTLMIRGNDFLYYVGLEDDSGPAAVAGFQEWQAAHVEPKPATG